MLRDNKLQEAFVERSWIRAARLSRPLLSLRSTSKTGLTRAAVTDRQGAYALAELPIGHYQVEVHARGFQKYLQQGISLDVNETATVSIHLKVGAETQQVEVRADAALVQSTVSSLGEAVHRQT